MDEKLIEIKNASDFDEFYSKIYSYLLYRLELPSETQLKSIYYLVVYSLKRKMPDEDLSTLESRIGRADCHQTSYVVSKKALLMMEIEKALGVKIGTENVIYSDDFDYYTNVLWKKLNEKKA